MPEPMTCSGGASCTCGQDPTAAERAREVILSEIGWDLGGGKAARAVAQDTVGALLAHPSLLAALAVEAGGMEQDGWRFEAPQVFGSEWSPGVTPPPFPNRWPVYRRVEGERE